MIKFVCGCFNQDTDSRIFGLTALLLESELTLDQNEILVSVKECADLLLHIINSVLDLA